MQLFQTTTWDDSRKCWNGHYITVPDFLTKTQAEEWLKTAPPRDAVTVTAWLRGMGSHLPK